MDLGLKDKVALVTGGAGGIGKAICIRLATEGAMVIVNDVNLEQGSKVADEIKAVGHEALPVHADVTKSEQVGRMVSAVLDRFARIDILVNVAGGGARGKASLFHESMEEVRDSVIDLNLKGVLNCCRAVVGHMIEKRSGKIISIASVGGMRGLVKQADYSAAKAGVICFTKVLAKEVGHYGVHVNCVSPGLIETSGRPKTREQREDMLKTVSLGRFGKPEEVACVVTFLASDEASYITGQNIAVCGGRSI